MIWKVGEMVEHSTSGGNESVVIGMGDSLVVLDTSVSHPVSIFKSTVDFVLVFFNPMHVPSIFTASITWPNRLQKSRDRSVQTHLNKNFVRRQL